MWSQKHGAKQVPLKGYDDMLLGISKSGNILPPQLIYQGKTDLCHPSYKFPPGWDIFHSPSHWSTSETMARYVENVIVPYIDGVREELDIGIRHKALCIFDVYKAHRGEELLNLLAKNAVRVVYVPAACTDQLQPLDLIPNNIFKTYLRSEFHSYYSKEVERQLSEGTDIENVNIDIRLSVIKPLHAGWVVGAIDKLKCKPDLIRDSFAKAGI